MGKKRRKFIMMGTFSATMALSSHFLLLSIGLVFELPIENFND
jgi:hypothetical protein